MSLMCVYQDCLSVKYPCSRIAFFRLPTDDRRSTWIRNSGNKSLLKISEKAQRFFCENHFRTCDINSQFNRKLLRRDAVPIEHVSLAVAKIEPQEDSGINANEPVIETINPQNSLQKTNTELIECLEHNNDYQNLFEELERSTTADTAADGSCGHPYSLLEFYDDGSEEPSTTGIIIEKGVDELTKTNEKLLTGESLEIYLEENSNNNQVDSSTIELEEQNDVENIETLEEEEESTEFVVPNKRKRPNEIVGELPVAVATANSEIIQVQLPTVSNSYNSYEEDKHFALSLVGYFQRMSQGKKALAKLKILQYLTELEVDMPTSL